MWDSIIPPTPDFGDQAKRIGFLVHSIWLWLEHYLVFADEMVLVACFLLSAHQLSMIKAEISIWSLSLQHELLPERAFAEKSNETKRFSQFALPCSVDTAPMTGWWNALKRISKFFTSNALFFSSKNLTRFDSKYNVSLKRIKPKAGQRRKPTVALPYRGTQEVWRNTSQEFPPLATGI